MASWLIAVRMLFKADRMSWIAMVVVSVKSDSSAMWAFALATKVFTSISFLQHSVAV